MATKAERARAKSLQIRSAAQPLFLERGFGRTTTDAIAAAASVSKQTLYRHYPTKEALLGDCLQDLIERHRFTGDEIAATSLDGRDELRAALLALAERIVEALMQPEYVALARVVVAETPSFPHLGAMFRSASRSPSSTPSPG